MSTRISLKKVQKMKKIIWKLKKFIEENPPLDEEGKPKCWSESNWEENLTKEIPNWMNILKNINIWKEIKGVKPKRNYDCLLNVILQYAPPEILKDYLTSDNPEERKSAYRILIEDNAKRLTVALWQLLNTDTKIWLISKISDEVLKRSYPRFLENLHIFIHHPEYFFERLRRRYKIVPLIYQHVISLAFIEAIFNEELKTLHPLWLKLKATVEEASDLSSWKRIEEIEHNFKERIQRIAEKVKSIFSIFEHQYVFPSKNVLFDPSLLLDYKKAQKALNFMKEYREEFNFFISSSFINALKSDRWHNIARFFECAEDIPPQKIVGMLEEYSQYYTLFEAPKYIYYVYKEKYRYFLNNLYRKIEDWNLVRILFEEWIFLQEYSWIVAKSKKTFEKFKEAGAITIEFSEKAIDKIVKRTLKKKNDEFVNTFDKLRALGKWIAVGGASATSFMNPYIATLVGFSAGIFLLLDPEDYENG